MQFFIVDVFAEKKYQGNQLAVFVPDREPTALEMQQIAREINFAETTFILSRKQENGGYDVRIFTPDIEVPFAGHPTLGTAYIIHRVLEQNENMAGKVTLNLGVGAIPVVVDDTGLTMRQNQPSFGMLIERRGEIADILHIEKDDICDDYPIQIVSTGLASVITPLKTVDAVKRCAIHHGRFQRFIDTVFRGNLLVFSSDTDNHLRVRVFAEDSGFPEDAATGSANGNLAGYLLKYDFFRQNAITYNVRQGYEINRPSLLRIAASLIDGAYDIQVGGTVHLVANGEWHDR